MQTEEHNLTYESVVNLIKQNNQLIVDGLKEFAKELKKPNEYEQAKIDKEQVLLHRKQDERLRLGAIHEQQKLMRMLSCDHVRPDGAHTWTGQGLSDGTFVPTCSQCWSQLPKIPVTREQIQNGINLNTYKGLKMAHLLEWHKKSYAKEIGEKGDCGNTDCIACHPEKLDQLRDSLNEQAQIARERAALGL